MMKVVNIKDEAPVWTAQAIMPGNNNNRETKTISLKDYIGQYVLLLFISTNFTSLSLSEIITYSKRQIEFDSINCQIIVISNDSYYTILSCINNYQDEGMKDLKIPIISDFNRRIVKQYGLINDNDNDDNNIIEGLFLISNKGIIRHMCIIDENIGKSVDELVRLVKAFQFTDEHGEVCPANWKPGDMTIKASPIDSLDYFNNNNNNNNNTVPANNNDNNTTSVRLRLTREFTPAEEVQMKSLLNRLWKIIGNQSDFILITIKKLILIYNLQLEKYPLITKAITSGIIGLISESLRVYITKRKLAFSLTKSTQMTNQIMNPNDIISLSIASKFSWRKVSMMGAYGLVISGPMYHYWYQFLDLLVVNKINIPLKIRLLVKVAINQLALTPAFLAFTLGFMEYLCSNRKTSCYNNIRKLYVKTLFTNWKIITILKAINLGRIPAQYNVLINDLINIWWYSYLTHLTTFRR